jgi:Secretion system C-terminal sorting domain
MKTLYKSLLFLAILLSISTVNAQVSKLNYLLEYNEFDSTYSVYIKIVEGSSITSPHRAQFNSQISFAMPAQTKMFAQKMVMPLQGNLAYNGKNPLVWTISSQIESPNITPTLKYISILPSLSPTSFYNDLKPEDEVKLFSFKVSPQPSNPGDIRFFDNETDPKSNQPGMAGGDFSNHFTIGGIAEDYNGNLPLRIVNIVSTKNIVLSDINVYPNPVSNVCTIHTKESIQKYKVLNAEGKVVLAGNSMEINFASMASGIYYLHIYTANGNAIKKVIKQ